MRAMEIEAEQKERLRIEAEEKEKLHKQQQEEEHKLNLQRWQEEDKQRAKDELEYIVENVSKLILSTPRFVVPDEYHGGGYLVRQVPATPIVELNPKEFALGVMEICKALNLSSRIRCQTKCGCVYRPRRGGKQESGLEPGINRLESGCHVCWVIANLPNDDVLETIPNAFMGELYSDRRLKYNSLMGQRSLPAGESLRSRMCVMAKYVSQMEYDLEGVGHRLSKGCLATVEAFYKILYTPKEYQVWTMDQWLDRRVRP
jgi:hypothetical protein